MVVARSNVLASLLQNKRPFSGMMLCSSKPNGKCPCPPARRSNPLRLYSAAPSTMTPKDSSSTNSSAMAKLGRKGDPRMHRAVAARLASPDLPLLDALRQGGFEFPAANGEHDSTLVDLDGVTLGQRKNQLSRRLRLAKKDESAEGNRKPENNINNNNNRTSVTVVSSTGAPLQGHHFSQAILKEGLARKRFRRASFSENGDAEDDVDMADDSMDRKAKYHPEFHPVRRGSVCCSNITNLSTNRGFHYRNVALPTGSPKNGSG